MRRSEAGVALVEALVAMVVLGLVSLVTLETLRFVGAGHDRARTASDAGAAVTAQGEALRALLTAALPLEARDADGVRRTLFDGTADRLVLVAPASAARPLDPSAPAHGLAIVELRAAFPAEDAAPAGLAIRTAPFGLPRATAAETAAPVVLAGLGPGVFAYLPPPEDLFEEDRAPRDDQWRDAWDGDEGQPALIRLTFAAADGAPRPALIAAPFAAPPEAR